MITLRVLGTSVTLLECLRVRAEKELGIRLVYQVHDVAQAQRIAVMQPDSYDLYDQWFHNVDFVWPARAIQPIDTRRIALWHEINDLPKRGRLSANDRLGGGSVPSERLFVQHDGSLGSSVTERISMLPLTHNADSDQRRWQSAEIHGQQWHGVGRRLARPTQVKGEVALGVAVLSSGASTQSRRDGRSAGPPRPG